MNSLYDLLKESAVLYENLLELEHEKYDAVVKADINALDVVVSREQACYMKMRGLEQKREKMLEAMGFGGETLSEIAELSDGENRPRMIEICEELKRQIAEVKEINDASRTMLEVRLHRVDKAMSMLGEKENTYSNKDTKDSSGKSLIISKKI